MKHLAVAKLLNLWFDQVKLPGGLPLTGKEEQLGIAKATLDQTSISLNPSHPQPRAAKHSASKEFQPKSNRSN